MRAQVKNWIIRSFLRYDGQRFLQALGALGIRGGDCLMVHASWSSGNGFSGKPADAIGVMREAVGEAGILSMPSLTYQNESTRDFLARHSPVNIRRSPSKMGLLSEVFRRGRGVHRSLSPSHPVLACGHDAQDFLAGHERCLVPFGEGSPFHRLLLRDGKILCIDAPFSTITYTHYLEDRISPQLPYPLYDPEPMEGIVIDYDKREHRVPVKVISAEANALRREARLVAALAKAGIMRKKRIGNTRLLLLSCREMTECVDHMAARGEFFFDAPDP